MPDVRCPSCSHSWSIHVSQSGQSVVCPHCGRSLTAPALAIDPVVPAPLSLDDAEQLPPLSPPPPLRRKRLPTTALALLSLLVTGALMAGVWYGFQRNSGTLEDLSFHPLTLDDCDCESTMPSGYTRESFDPEGYAMLSGERFSFESRWRGVRLEIDCIHLDPATSKNTTVEQIAFAQRDRRTVALGATKVRESSLQLYAAGTKFDGLEYGLELPDRSKCVERIHGRIDGDRPMVWILSVRGGKVSPTTPWVLRWLNDFRPTRGRPR